MRAPRSSWSGVPEHFGGTAIGQNNASRAVDADDRLGGGFQQGDQQFFVLVEDSGDIGRAGVLGGGMVGVVDHGRSFRSGCLLTFSLAFVLKQENPTKDIPPKRGE